MEEEVQAAKAQSAVESVKAHSSGLRGTIADELRNEHAFFSADAQTLLKFHGVYTQDDRDQRSILKRAGKDLAHMCMIRLAPPGGRLTSAQYIAFDGLADRLGNSTLRITTRQGIQYHFVAKSDLHELIATVNAHLVSTYAACGDVVRNVTSCPSRKTRVRGTDLDSLADELSRRYKPASSAYYELWVDGEKVNNADLDAPTEEEWLYGSTYLPRKFKIGLATTVDNCVDVLTNDIGLIVDADDPQRILVTVGGGLGRSHYDETTLALLAQPLAWIERSDLIALCDAIILMQRDHGNREDRAHARLKYLVKGWGIDKVRAYLSDSTGIQLAPAQLPNFEEDDDHLGVSIDGDGTFSYGLKVPNGRVANFQENKVKDALAKIAKERAPELRLTAKEDILLTGLDSEGLKRIEAILSESDAVASERYPELARRSFACVALPTCGLALAESERYLPELLEQLGAVLSELELQDQPLELRMTGCPNGCARPYSAEIGIVGRSKNSYDIHLGASRDGTRISELWARDVHKNDLVSSLRPILELYRADRKPDESFGDFCARFDPILMASLAPAPRRQRRVTVEAE